MRNKKPHSHHYRLWLVLVVILYCVWTLSKSLPTLSPLLAVKQSSLSTGTSQIAWPESGQAAVAAGSGEVLAYNGSQTSQPIASTAKLITALSVLRVKPLTLGQQGPKLTLSAADVALYRKYTAEDGSVVPVIEGEKISEYQVLEAMMLPSANNMADSLAIWAFGSLGNYRSYAQKYVAQLDMTHTTIGNDASGFDPSTKSTSSDLVRLGQAVMQNPVLAQIVGTPSATIPVAGTITNINYLLGSNGIVGIKTGNTDQAGGVFISASKQTIDSYRLTFITAVLGAPDLSDAITSSVPLITTTQQNLQDISAAQQNQVVGAYKIPWGSTVNVIVAKPLHVLVWQGQALTLITSLHSISATTKTDQQVGSITTKQALVTPKQTVALHLAQTVKAPSLWWRLTHPL